MVDRSLGMRVFRIVNGVFFAGYAAICLFPMFHLLAISLSSSLAVTSGRVTIVPVEFTLRSYEYVMGKQEFWNAMGVSFLRVFLGVSVNMVLTTLAAYPLSKNSKQFRGRTVLAWVFFFTMLFGGGMIPTYMVVRATGLLDSVWALVLPGAVPVFSVLLMSNYFRSIPKDLEDCAFLDGAGHWRTLFSIYLILSGPVIATLTVFAIVTHWNSWFDGLIYINESSKYPLQTYLQSILVNPNIRILTRQMAELLRRVSDRTVKAAQVFIAAIPVLVVYPFLQRFFISGIMLGSVKE